MTTHPAESASEEGLALVVGRVYRAKRPADSWGLVNDRQIKWVGLLDVQYDSPTIISGRKYPTVKQDAFRKWAARDVTDEMPKGLWMDWRDFRKGGS